MSLSSTSRLDPMASSQPGTPTRQIAPPLLSRDGMLCAALLVLCLIIARPVAEVGVNDDWVYTLTALDFARTGHFIFHGWASPLLGWQAMWGALFAKLFGATFTAVRLSNIPVAAAAALLYHAVLRRFGLNSSHATFGTLVLILSPVFFPLSASFMTDVPAVFAILLCIYLCQLAIAATTNARTILLLTAAALSNIAFGTVRQIAWLGVLVMIPSCVWLLRRRRYVPQIGATLWLIGVICIYLMMHWFGHQPYTAPEHLIPGALTGKILAYGIHQIVNGVLTTLLLVLPVLAIGWSSLWPLRRPMVIRTLWILCVLLLLIAVFHLKGQAHLVQFPWLGNTFGPHGILQDPPLFGSNRTIPTLLQILLFLFVVLSAFASLVAFNASRRKPLASQDAPPQVSSWCEISILLLPFLTCYCLLLLPRAAFFALFDRYLLEIVAVLLIYALRWHQQRMSDRIPAIGTATLAVIATLTVAGTHDLFSMYRAQVRLANELQAAGIPRTEIRGGFAYDFTTQSYAWGYLNDERTTNPPGAYHFQPDPTPYRRDGVECQYGIQRYIPALHTRYVISADPSPCLGPTHFAPQTYRTWLPPARRELFAGTLLPPIDQPASFQ